MRRRWKPIVSRDTDLSATSSCGMRRGKWAGAARNRKKQKTFRILVMHHHLVPIIYRAQPIPSKLQSIVLDAEAIMRWIVKHKINLVLHGHMHQPHYVKICRTQQTDWTQPEHSFHIISMGSTGVQVAELNETRENTFGVLSFEPEALTVTVYTVSPAARSRKIREVKIPYQADSGFGAARYESRKDAV